MENVPGRAGSELCVLKLGDVRLRLALSAVTQRYTYKHAAPQGARAQGHARVQARDAGLPRTSQPGAEGSVRPPGRVPAAGRTKAGRPRRQGTRASAHVPQWSPWEGGLSWGATETRPKTT